MKPNEASTIHSRYEIVPGGHVSELFLSQGLTDLRSVLRWVQALRYERISNARDVSLVVQEQRGTCSSKHAVVALLANEQGWHDVKLVGIIYKMTEENTPGVGVVLKQRGISYVIEAHTMLRFKGLPVDITGISTGSRRALDDMLEEREMTVSELLSEKVLWHKAKWQRWLESHPNGYTFEENWLIREACIDALSKKAIT